jgi:5-methylcytosine-specific restriction endonuclease McrA
MATMNCIQDEFTDLPLSRQWKYQLRRQRDARCPKCGKPTEGHSFCLNHRAQANESRRRKRRRPRFAFCIYGH